MPFMKPMHGYTLLELAIVLVVLALLVGGILMWQGAEASPPRAFPTQSR